MDGRRSNKERVVLREVGLRRGGQYGCRVVIRENGVVDEDSCRGGGNVGRGRMVLGVE